MSASTRAEVQELLFNGGVLAAEDISELDPVFQGTLLPRLRLMAHIVRMERASTRRELHALLAEYYTAPAENGGGNGHQEMGEKNGDENENAGISALAAAFPLLPECWRQRFRVAAFKFEGAAESGGGTIPLGEHQQRNNLRPLGQTAKGPTNKKAKTQAPNTMQLFVHHDKTYTIEVNRTGATVEDLKQAIFQKLSVPLSKFYLTYGGRHLDGGGRLLSDCGVYEYSTISVRFRLLSCVCCNIIEISVRCAEMNGVFTVNTNRRHSMALLKYRIAAELGVPVERQTLVFEGKQLDDERKTFEDYGIGRGATLELTIREPERSKK